MKEKFTVVCRGSWLSLAQAELFIAKVGAVAPEIEISILVKETAGDLNQDVVLQQLEGKDFFTKDIQNCLQNGEADFAVHSLKDVSGENFFNGNHYAIFDREDPRDVAIFNEEVEKKINAGQSLSVGTSSPRRATMALDFLREALPKKNHKPLLEPKPIRGNVDTRLRKLSEGQFDGVVLAAAGLTRLLRYPPSREEVKRLLTKKKLMALPLFECPPAPGQGAIVAETVPENKRAIELLEQVNHPELVRGSKFERAFAEQYGAGCHQEFGVIHLALDQLEFTFGAGAFQQDGKRKLFSEYRYVNKTEAKGTILDAADALYEKRFYHPPQQTAVLFVEDFDESKKHDFSGSRLWASDTQTWRALASKGWWVEGCADGLGHDQIERILGGPLFHADKEFGYAGSFRTYTLKPNARELFANADFILWHNVEQYVAGEPLIKAGVCHGCLASGIKNFKDKRIDTVCFPEIKAFEQWRKENIPTKEG